MKFSVLIPVYNTEKYLEDCLQSVLNQTYQDFEIILVDDGSTDSSGKICDKYAEDYPGKIKVIHQKNQGQLASRLNAVKVATGEYVVFADADDLLIDNALEVINSNLEKYKLPDMLIYSFVYEETKGTRKATKLFDEGIVKKENLYHMFFTGTGLNNVWTKAVKHEIVLCNAFDFSPYFELRCSEDKLYSMIMVDQCHTVAYIYEPLYRYRLFDGSVTRNYSTDNIDKFISVSIYETEKLFMKKWKLPLPEWQQRIDAHWANAAIHTLGLFCNHNKGEKRKKSIRYDWTKLISPETVRSIPDNPYINEIGKKIWKWIINKDYFQLQLYYAKKRLRKKVKGFIKK